MEAEKPYDSTEDTLAHIDRVRTLLGLCREELLKRATFHDLSKLEEPEKSAFDIATPKLKSLTYGSDEYKASLMELQVALDHHYANNRHHPEHFLRGVKDMSVFDILEMLMDWKAAGERHADGDIFKSININITRFGIGDQLAEILMNTAADMFTQKTATP